MEEAQSRAVLKAGAMVRDSSAAFPAQPGTFTPQCLQLLEPAGLTPSTYFPVLFAATEPIRPHWVSLCHFNAAELAEKLHVNSNLEN